MSKSNKKQTKKAIIDCLQNALDYLEGEHSNIPLCCIGSFVIDKSTYESFRSKLSKKDQKKLLKWEYVPCETCFKNNKVNDLNKNGTSDLGQILRAATQVISDRIDSLDQ